MAPDTEIIDFNAHETSVIALRSQSKNAQASPESNIVFLEEKMLATVNRAISVVSSETKALRDEVIVDLRPHSDAKSRALLDLNRVMGDLDIREAPMSVINELRVLRQVLDDNEQLLSSHLEAVREITDLLSLTMIKAESDGTYTSNSIEAM